MDEKSEQTQLEMLRTLDRTTADLINLDTAYQMAHNPTADDLQEIQDSLSQLSVSLGNYIKVLRQEGEQA